MNHFYMLLHFTITHESCVTKNNGSITISAFAEFDYTYNLIGPNGFSLDGSFSRQSGETINNLQSGDYMLCIYSNNDQQIERCFTAVISEPEPLSVNTIINYNNQELNLNLGKCELGQTKQIDESGWVQSQYTGSKNYSLTRFLNLEGSYRTS